MSRYRVLLAALSAVLVGGCTGPGGSGATGGSLVVFAAASLTDVARELASEFEERHAVEVVLNLAGSNTLAQQIGAAPVADVFVSADERWIDHLEARGLIVGASRQRVLSNRLVLIAHRSSELALADPRDLAESPFRYLALADPQAVPAGRYARAHLESLTLDDGGNVWRRVVERTAPSPDVRAALALVESDPEIVGVVYRTDARSSERVKVLYQFPPLVEMPVSYVAVLVDGGASPELGRRFLDYLGGPAARAIAQRHGFLVPTG